MKRFSADIDTVPGLRFLFEAMEFQSVAGKRFQLSQQLLTDEGSITFQLEKVDRLQLAAADQKWLAKLKGYLADTRDISSALAALGAGQVLDEIALFDLKQFSITSEKIKQLLDGMQIVQFGDLRPVIEILDPEKSGISHFYLYDIYSDELAAGRKRYRELLHTAPELAEAEATRIAGLELKLRNQLSAQLRGFTNRLVDNFDSLAAVDAWLSRALLALRFGFSKPRIGHQLTRYHRLFNPAVARALQQKDKSFQPVDISFHHAPCVITGANMGGKTVLLKTLALCQYLFQYGFFVPAASAVIVVADEIFTSFNDEQSELKGLSSYAAEMLKITRIIHTARKGKDVLALLDEPARTTNPAEGEAIVNGLIDILQRYNIRSVITTHYSGLMADCLRLRVKGLRTDKISPGTGLDDIQELMDYDLVEVYPDGSDGMESQHGAFRIAAILGIDTELMERAGYYLEHKLVDAQTNNHAYDQTGT